MASSVRISQKYSQRVLQSIAKTKMVSSLLFFKNGDDIVMNTNDEKGQCRICIKTKEDNFAFEQNELGVYDINQLLKYMHFIEFGKSEEAVIQRVESKTTRGTHFDSLLLSGKIGQFVVTLPHADIFDAFNRVPTVARGSAVDTEETLATFALSREEISELESIANTVGAPKMSISIHSEGINLYFRGLSGNQYTKKLGLDHIRLYGINGSEKTYLDDVDYEKYIPFSISILQTASTFNENFVFDLVRRRGNGMIALKAFGGHENSIQPNEKYPVETSPIEYTIMTAVNMSDESSGTQNDIFEQFN